MSITSTAALNAYTAAARLAGQTQETAKTSSAQAQGDGFGDLVSSALGNVTEAGNTADAKAAQFASGEADVVDLVTAVAESEMAVETLVTVRDKVIESYQKILNMPI